MKDYTIEYNRLRYEVLKDLLDLINEQGEKSYIMKSDAIMALNAYPIGLDVSNVYLEVDRFFDVNNDYPLILGAEHDSLIVFSKDGKQFEYLLSLDDLCCIAGYLHNKYNL